MFLSAVEAQRVVVEVPVASVEAFHTRVGPEGNPGEGRDVAAEGRDRVHAAEEEVADRKLRTIAVVVHLAVSRRYAPEQKLAIGPRRA